MKTFTQPFIIIGLLFFNVFAFGKMESNACDFQISTFKEHSSLFKKNKSIKSHKKLKKAFKSRETKNWFGDFIAKFFWTILVIVIAAIGVEIVKYGLVNILNPAVAGGLFIGIGLGIVLIAIIGFFIIYPDLLWFT